MRLRDQAVRVIEQRHGGEDGQVFAELAMQRRRAAAQQRVVHRRQVVEDQRRGVDHLDRRGGGDELLRLGAEGLPDRDQQDAAHAFSGATRARGAAARRAAAGAPAARRERRRASSIDRARGGHAKESFIESGGATVMLASGRSGTL